MTDRVVVGLGHRRNCGKDSLAKWIQHEIAAVGAPVRRDSFARKLKESCADIYGWAGVNGPDYYEDDYARKATFLPALGMTVRDLWIRYGNAVRTVYPATWVDCVLQSYPTTSLIVTDVRYPNEAERIKQIGGLLIRVDRPGIEQFDDVADSALAGFDGWDMVVVNDGDMGKLREEARRVVGRLYPRGNCR